jgi:DNA repair exonuclease SbcCD ATPase subunit
MHIEKLTLTNVGPHRGTRVFDFKSAGLIGIIGANGSGKSTIVASIFAALTNDFALFPANKAAVASDTAAGEPSSITLDFVVSREPYQVYLDLRSTRGRLVKPNGEKLLKLTDICRELETLIGVTADRMSTYVVVPQWQVFSLLAQTPAKRAEAFQRLCRTEQAAHICDAIDAAVRTNPKLRPTPLPPDLDFCKASLSQLSPVYANNRELLVRAEARVSADDYAKLHADLEVLTSRERLSAEIARLGDAVAVQQKLVVDAQAVYDEAKGKLEGLAAKQSEAAEVVRSLETAKAAHVVWLRQRDAYEAHKRQIADASQAYAAAHEAVRNLQPSPPSSGYDAELLDCRVQHNRLSRLAKAFAAGESECSTCGAPRASVGADDAPAMLAAQTERLATLQKLKAESQAAEAKAADVQRRLSSAKASLDALKSVGVSPPTAVAFDRQAYDVAVAASQSAANAYQAAVTAANAAAGRLSSQQLSLAKLSGQRDANVQAMQALPVVTMSRDAVEQSISRMQADRQAAEELRATVTSQYEQLVRYNTTVAAAADIEASNRAAAAAQAKLDRLRGVFDKRALPQRVAQASLRTLEATMNGVLDDFGHPFYVAVTEDLSFNCFFPGAPARPAETLSGGWKAILAIALRFAILRHFDVDVGFLLLDEPAAGVDATNIGFLATAMDRLRGTLKTRQVVVVTHDERLLPVFDQVIDLSAA